MVIQMFVSFAIPKTHLKRPAHNWIASKSGKHESKADKLDVMSEGMFWVPWHVQQQTSLKMHGCFTPSTVQSQASISPWIKLRLLLGCYQTGLSHAKVNDECVVLDPIIYFNWPNRLQIFFAATTLAQKTAVARSPHSTILFARWMKFADFQNLARESTHHPKSAQKNARMWRWN